jgi:lipoprotein-anchoring transpeptidase ErfK/SrfK
MENSQRLTHHDGACHHGTYWHGNFGWFRSYGCLNATPEASRWFYRWTEPISPYTTPFVGGDKQAGTTILLV